MANIRTKQPMAVLHRITAISPTSLLMGYRWNMSVLSDLSDHQCIVGGPLCMSRLMQRCRPLKHALKLAAVLQNTVSAKKRVALKRDSRPLSLSITPIIIYYHLSTCPPPTPIHCLESSASSSSVHHHI